MVGNGQPLHLALRSVLPCQRRKLTPLALATWSRWLRSCGRRLGTGPLKQHIVPLNLSHCIFRIVAVLCCLDLPRLRSAERNRGKD